MQEAVDARARVAAFLRALDGAEVCEVLAIREGRRSREPLLARVAAAAAEAGPPELCERLRRLDEIGALDSDAAGALAARAAALQDASGAWARAPGGEPCIPTTGALVGLLAKSPRARSSSLDCGADWLAERFSPDLVQGFAFANVEAFSMAFANLLHDAADEILQWCGRELERGFRAQRFRAVETARVLAACDAPALPGGRIELAELAAAVVAEQADDGGFGATADERPGRSWDAWVSLGLLTGQR